MLLGIFPLIFLIYFAIQIIHEKQERVSIVRNVITNINHSILVSQLTSELHLERRLSFGYILDKNTSAELILQRGKTDLAVAALERNAPQSFPAYAKYSLLTELAEKRKLILSKQLSAEQALNYFSITLERLPSYYSTSVNNIPYLQSIGEDLDGQRLVFAVLNHFGALRAEVYNAFIKRSFTAEEFNEVQKSLSLTFSYADEFNAKASREAQAKFDVISKSEDSKYINNILANVTTSRTIPTNIDAEKWWNTTGKVIDNMIKIQSGLTETTRKKTEAILERENNSLYLAVFLLVLVIIVVIVFISYTIKNITDILNELRLAAEKISLGETNVQLDVASDDAIGSLAKSIKVIEINSNQLAKAAESIGHGNFDVAVIARSEKDILANAVIRMKEDLQKFSKESSEKIWVQTGLAAVHGSVRGEKTLTHLSGDILNCLVSYVGAQVGVMYISDNEILHLASSFALSSGYKAPKTLTFGETLIGEAARQKKTLYLDEIPEDYLKISSGSGEALPRHIIVLPLVHNEITEGVIEIGSFTPFTDAMQTLVEQAAQNVAIAVHTSKNRSKMQELLEETQAQAEELQAQHSELESLNTELEAQAQKLQASDEELRVQQEELLQTNEELEERSRILEEKNQLIVERNLDIQQKAEELELSTRYKSEFLANMSHELRTPLNSILLLSRLMYENPENNLTSEQVEYAQVIQSSGNGLLALIDEILDLSKIEAGKMDLEYADVLIKDITGDMRSLFAPIAKEKNLEFSIDVAADVPQKISTDKLRVEQIIKNLLSNALKFTARGSVKLSISTSENPKYLSISVKDTGIGIAKEKQAHIFEAFQQADGSTRRKFGGTGLGLSISRELAKLLGGEIALYSEENAGSEFVLSLPVSQPAADKIKKDKVQNAAPIVAKSEPVRLPERETHVVSSVPQSIPDDRNDLSEADNSILIVEDDTHFAKALLSYTRKAGYKGLVAVRGDEGIEMALAYKPIAILLDIQLPVKDGWEVMEELKANPGTRHIPVHIMSSLEVKKESIRKGAVDFINKPIATEQMQQMFSKLDEALNKHPKKVLIIEENPQHAKALAYYLETFNVSSEIKGSVNEGIETLLQNDAECVILDMGIPDQNAYEILDNIKKNPGLEHLPIIIFTGKNLSKAEEGRLKHYADSIVMKTAHSYQRILDEVAVFLHLVEEKKNSEKPSAKQKRSLIELNEVLKDKTVLIADDDVRNIFSLTKALEQLKMKVISATDGREALAALESNPQVDIVLMDMMMPEMDGYESTKKIRKNIRYRNLPILAVTAKAMVGDREKCIQAGASDYISKPVDIDQLISLLRVWLYYKAV